MLRFGCLCAVFTIFWIASKPLHALIVPKRGELAHTLSNPFLSRNNPSWILREFKHSTIRADMVLNNAEDGHSQSVLPKDDDDDEEDCEIDLLTMECVPEETPVVVNVDEEDECEIDMETMQPLDPDKCLS